MSQDEILNYDPLRLNPAENLVELQEFIIGREGDTKVRSLLIPVSVLAGKTKEEVDLICWRTFCAFDIDISLIDIDAKLINRAAEELASRYTRLFTGNLILIYFERLARGDGTDPEMEIVKELRPGEVDDERDIAASMRLTRHVQSRTKSGLVSYFGEHLDLVRDFCREATVNILGKVTLSILEEKGGRD
jgi:hypothetical protein